MLEHSETEHIVHDVIPFFEKLGYPGVGDRDRVRIHRVPTYRPSGGRSGEMDLVYYHCGEPILVVEAKRERRSHDAALDEAKNYLRNFPIEDRHFAPTGKRPSFIATTVGAEIKFYKHWFEASGSQLNQLTKEVDQPLTFNELIKEYGYVPEFVPEKLTVESFKEDFLSKLIEIFVLDVEEGVKPEVISNITKLIWAYLLSSEDYTYQAPYTELRRHRDRQTAILDLFSKYDLRNSIGWEIALCYRQAIIRAFQGSNQLNQYITPWEVIEFMTQLVDLKAQDTVMDFECGSGGFLAAAVGAGVPLNNIRGIDIADLPYYVTKLFLALYFGLSGKDVDRLDIKYDNGLFYWGNDWDVIISNPAGGSNYELNDLEQVYQNLERDLSLKGDDDTASEYNFSIQQAVRSAKVGGRICLVLPEGPFSNSSLEFLRKYIVKHCKVNAIISLPRGVFHKGTTTRSVTSGQTTTNQKMSILYATKIREVIDGEGVEVDFEQLDYPVFLAAVQKPHSNDLDKCLDKALSRVLEDYKVWERTQNLTTNTQPIEFDEQEDVRQTEITATEAIAETKEKRRPPATEKTIIPKDLEDIF